MNSLNPVAHRESFDAFIRRRQDVLTIPWLCTTASIGLFSIVLSLTEELVPEPVTAAVTYTLMALGCLLAAASGLWLRRACSDARVAAEMRREPYPRLWSTSMRLDPDQRAFLLALPKSEQRLVGLTWMFQKPYLIALGLSEAVAALGLVFGLLSKNLLHALPYLLGAVVLNALNYPRLGPLMVRGRKLDQPDEELQELERTLSKMHEGLNSKPSPPTSNRPPPPSNRPPPRRSRTP